MYPRVMLINAELMYGGGFCSFYFVLFLFFSAYCTAIGELKFTMKSHSLQHGHLYLYLSVDCRTNKSAVVAIPIAGCHNRLEEPEVEILLSMWPVVGYWRRRWSDVTWLAGKSRSARSSQMWVSTQDVYSCRLHLPLPFIIIIIIMHLL